ncbi:MAG: class I SAM-dependent methyltransferase [Acidobacteriota bacterium]|nr:class I SAM-dependent methyltransferase [Acidobacteriota bacterium]
MTESTCPYCGRPGKFAFRAGDHLYEVTDYQADLYRCENCASLYQEPVPTREVIAEFYPGGYWQESSGKPSLMNRLQATYIRWMLEADLMRLVTKMGPAAGAWLDIGCSRGDWAALIRDRGWRVSGLEADPRAAAYARETHGLTVEESDGDSWNPEPETWDVISFFHLLEHLRQPKTFLVNCRKALRPGGRILLRVPNINSWQFALFGKRWKGLEMPRHITLPTPDALKAALKEAGFEINHASTWALRDGPPSIASSLLPAGEPTRQQIKRKPQPVMTLLYLAFTWTFLPLELLAALLGRGSMLTIIASTSSYSRNTGHTTQTHRGV